MKSICLVDRVKWKFEGNMNPHAFDFGDVDNDKVLKVIMKFFVWRRKHWHTKTIVCERRNGNSINKCIFLI